jgi:phage tail-like protein
VTNQPDRLIISTPDGERVLPLTKAELKIGRNLDNDVVLAYRQVSGAHARIDMTPEGPTITDVGSTNGTLLDGTRLDANQPYRLAPGMTVQIFQCTLRYEPAGAAQPEAEPEPEEPPEAPVRGTISEPPLFVEEEEAPLPPVREPREYRAPWDGTPSRYLHYLPSIFADGGFMGRYLRIFETIWEPLEWRQNHVQLYFDPLTCPAPLLPWLASWFDLTLDPTWPEARCRNLVAAAAVLYRARGTRDGLQRMIEVVTGLRPEVREDPGRPFVFTVSLTIPAGSEVSVALVDELVRTHKPAHAGYVLEITRG